MDQKASFLTLFSTILMLSFSTQAMLEIEADLELGHTHAIQQSTPLDDYAYFSKTPGHYNLKIPIRLADATFYDPKTHVVRFSVELSELERAFPSRSVSFKIGTVPWEVGKAQYEPHYDYEFKFNLPTELRAGSKFKVHPSQIFYTAPVDEGNPSRKSISVSYTPPVPPFCLIQEGDI